MLHLTLFLTSAFISVQVFVTLLASTSTVLRRVFLGLPLPHLLWGFHSRACLAKSLGGFHGVRPSHPHLHFLICISFLVCFVCFHNSSFFIWSGHKILNIFLRHKDLQLGCYTFFNFVDCENKLLIVLPWCSVNQIIAVPA